MYRRKTVDLLLRQAARERSELLAIIREQNERIMVLAGTPYAPTPRELHHELAAVADERDHDDVETVELGQLPDDLGFPV